MLERKCQTPVLHKNYVLKLIVLIAKGLAFCLKEIVEERTCNITSFCYNIINKRQSP